MIEETQPRVANCAWCGSSLDGSAVRLRGRTQCPACGAATTDPWPSEEQLRACLRILVPARIGSLRIHRRPAAAPDPRVCWRVASIGSRRPGRSSTWAPVKRVLIDALRRRGREAVGLERDSRRQDMRDDPLERVEGEWAAVVFWHSLEHLPDPGGAIRRGAPGSCGPGGILVIAVPNTDSLQARAFGDRWLHLDPPRHLVHLSERALRSRLTACGFAGSASRTSAVGRS